MYLALTTQCMFCFFGWAPGSPVCSEGDTRRQITPAYGAGHPTNTGTLRTKRMRREATPVTDVVAIDVADHWPP
ncbi:hypothetical protein BDP55DRAFT_687188 [Colletotrichum godetiae]|uniref:Secreted protein n=1 Tax=Colletotrichum godetiae TaxID=1209918 RepID=A0AAJ0A5Q3_9PEZI|nr:uncharacterized protein BDP55DRAFT_687188 [Colletotrichum godetiae]KAK1656991.1 hypothetical protein BDP55DRAFT_687188 [Colletotrichum godetiae]